MDRAAARRWIALDRAVNAAGRAANRNAMKTPASAASRAASKSLRSVLGAAENVPDKDLERLVLNLNLTVEQIVAMIAQAWLLYEHAVSKRYCRLGTISVTSN